MNLSKPCHTIFGLIINANAFPPCSHLSQDGFWAYDAGLKSEVLVMMMVFCFLGNTPMHAEITNTPMPSSSLNLCHICSLSVDARADKVTNAYVQKYLGISSMGELVCTALISQPSHSLRIIPPDYD